MTLPLNKLMNPRAIAIVGASERPEAIGTRVRNNLRIMGFPGPIYLVNPRYPSLDGETCYPSLAALPEVVDAVFIAVPASGGPELVEEAGKCGIKAVFINANGYADGDADGVALQRRIEASAKQYGIAIAGPNNLGLINVHDKKAMWTPRYMKRVNPGPIAVISQSGSIALILAEDERDLGFAYLVTTGNEAGANVADYLGEVARDDRVGVILMFLETIREPAKFAAAAREAAKRGKRIVALKLGTSDGGRALVQAHTGSLAGEDRLYDAYFRALGIVRVRDLDEMLETAVILAASSAPPTSQHTVIVTLSGGEAALLADTGEELGLPFAPLAAETLAALRPAYPPYSTVGNPVDAWGLGFNGERFRIVLKALLDDPAIGTVGFSVDAPGRGGCDTPYACIMAEACAEQKTDKRLVFINNTSGSGVNPDVRKILDAAGIPYLSGMRTALAAIRNMVKLPAASPAEVPMPAAATQAIPAGEPARFKMLAAAGVPMIASETVASAAEAVAQATGIGYPVVMKGIADHLPHKSDLGLVRLGLADAAAVSAAYAALEAILEANAKPGSPAEIVVEKSAGEGIELIVGIRNQKGFGSFVIAGVGGVLVEIANKAAVRLGPVDEAQALAMLEETIAGKLLHGVRGKGPWDIAAAAKAIAAFSRFGAAHAESLAALEINPLIVGAKGAVGVDVLLEAFE
jgi:acyl-CoA synthetase (NDP forming)